MIPSSVSWDDCLGSGTDSSAARSSSGLALWLLENGAELNPRASVREDDAGSRGEATG